MTRLLAIDVGSSSIKASVVTNAVVTGQIVTAKLDTPGSAVRPETIWHALLRTMSDLRPEQIDVLGLTGMGPGWLAMDAAGAPMTDIVMHSDRSSLEQARRIEATVGRDRHLRLAGNRPTPGGISSTSAAHAIERQPDLVRKAAMFGHWPTWLIRRLTGSWTMDPSNAGFSGLMDVSTGDWSEELCAAAGVPIGNLPPIHDAGHVHGKLRPGPAAELSLPEGLPVVGGFIDGSGPLLLARATVGQLVHSAGSTDVLAVCLDAPRPTDGLLCRPLGTDGKWVAVATLSSGGSLLAWVHDRFARPGDPPFTTALNEARNHQPNPDPPTLEIDPRFGGDRQTVEQPAGTITGLTLDTPLIDLLHATLQAIEADRQRRYETLATLGTPFLNEVITTGRAAGTPTGDWTNRHTFRSIDEATLLGCWPLVER